MSTAEHQFPTEADMLIRFDALWDSLNVPAVVSLPRDKFRETIKQVYLAGFESVAAHCMGVPPVVLENEE